MKKHLKTLAVGSLAALVLTQLCGTARADLATNIPTAYPGGGLAWATDPSGKDPFYSSGDLTNSGLFSGAGSPTADTAAGATASVLGETITITNGAGNIGLASGVIADTNYVLTGISLLVSGYSTTPYSFHIFDVTDNLTGGVINSGASYDFTANGDLLGGGSGLLWTNNHLSGALQQVYLGLQNGPVSQDQVVLAADHIYAIEVWIPDGAGTLYAQKSSAAPQDSGGELMGSKDARLSQNRITGSALGFYGSSQHTWAIALYGYPTAAAPSVNTRTNEVTHLTVDQFNPLGYGPPNIYVGTNDYSLGYGTNIWADWFGSAYTNAEWDATSDAQGNPSSGSLKITAVFQNGGQYLVWDRGPNNTYPGINPPITNGLGLLTFQCDVRFDPSSATTVNGSVTNYGHLQFGIVPPYSQDNLPLAVEVPVENTNWVHVTIPLDATKDENLLSISGIYIKIDGGWYASHPLNGTSILWVDNIQFTALNAPPAPPPPPTMSGEQAMPALRIFAGSTVNTYDREEVTTVGQDQSWISPVSYPVSYSFTLLSYPDSGINQTHIFLIPANFAGGNNMYGNEYIDYQAANALWLNISPAGGGSNFASVRWKTNLPNANPDHTALITTNAVTVGTWTLTFNNESSGTLTAPGGSPAAFTITNANVATDFANPVVAYFGLQPNSTVGQGLYEDWASISITGVAGGDVSEDFTKQAYDFDPSTYTSASGLWRSDSSAMPSSVVIVRTNQDFAWVNWTLPAVNFELGSSTNLPASVWINPAYYSAYTDITPPRGAPAQFGSKNWVLLPIDDLPTSDGFPFGPLSPNAFFLVATNVLSPQ